MASRPPDDGEPRAANDHGPLGDLPRRAVEQATEVITRFLETLEPAVGDRLDVDEPPTPGFAQMRADVGRMADLYVDLFRRTFDAYADLAERSARQPSLWAAPGRGARDELLLRASGGGRDEVTVYIHNHSGEAVGPVDLHVSALTMHDGSVLAPSAVELVPARIDKVEDGGCEPAALVLEADGARPGTYHGHVLAEGLILPVRVVIEGA